MTAVVTGLGVAAPNGLGLNEYWKATVEGVTGIGPIDRFDATHYPVKLAGEVRGFIPEEHLPSRLIPQTDHMTRLAITASDWALADAGVNPDDVSEYGMGVVTASSCGGFDFGQRELENLWARGPEHVSAYQSFAWFYAVNTGQISIRHGMRGPSGVLVTDAAGGLDAVGHARRHIRRGIPLVVTGAADSSLCPWGLVAQLPCGLLSAAIDPQAAYLPFDARACGYVQGEGAAILVLEDLVTACARGAQIYGEIAGYAATFDPHPGSDREPGLRRAIELALADAGVQPSEVDVVFADALAVPELDRIEADAIAAVFGPRGIPVTAPKTMTGRLYAAGGALDLIAALLAIRDSVIPPTAHVRLAQAYPIDLVTGAARLTPIDTALLLARGYRGFNAALLVRRMARHARKEPTWTASHWTI
jgi:act minimal PKS chain-length factor (CLF/KS beta)